MSKSLEILNNVFGHEAFRGKQEDAVEAVISGRDVILLASTGGGKSVCYQIPALVRDGVGVVVSPLKALMKDQIDTLQFLGVAADTINSDVTGYDRLNVMNAIRKGEVDLLYVTPELLAQPKFMAFLKEVKIACFGIDEAHAASAYGHDFRPDYQVLGLLSHHFPGVPRIAVTATADPQTLADIKEMLNLHDALVLETSLDRTNISLSIEKRDSAKQQQAKMLEIIRSRQGQSGLVYCVGKNTVDKVAKWLASEGVSALPYHAGHSNTTREDNQEAFLRGEVDILVCTVAFGMGVDKSDVRYVIHNDMPSSIEAYQQETGRAGRDGLPSDAFMFVGNQDINIRKRMIRKSKGGAASKRTDNNKLDTLIGLAESVYCRRRAIINYFGKQFVGDCGNCDNCQREVEGVDVCAEILDIVGYLRDHAGVEDTHSMTVVARDRFAARRLTEERWSLIVRQMIVNGLVEVRHSDCGRLHLTAEGKAFTGDNPFLVVKKVALTSAKFAKSPRSRSLTVGKRASSPRKPRARAAAGDYMTKPRRSRRKANVGSPLLEALRAMRDKLAKEEGREPYFIIHDTALRQMAEVMPLTGDEMLTIKGVGQAKVASYAHRFIPVIRKHAA
ncbi:ATP-dependent DNA helicase [Pararhizobium sp. BT-229]|uniref:RecQ family ATP-dependent DNA helicase n=1 Tax=Pararhizobium sp. BT-229 TaxID=2986923 RepID=UPI0021F6EA01|nr:ATP-dependent DNA helicase RecQ [Pararhizobium sp. BT-229]MCV9964130.1 ATP-dependent DNA helicase [Pararhizobium sp. BT-229]